MAATSNQNDIEIIVKTKMDVKQFENSLINLERKISVANKELEASASKISYIMQKGTKTLTEGAQASLKIQRDAFNVAERNLLVYKAQSTQLEKNIALAKENASIVMKSNSQLPVKSYLTDLTTMNSYYKAMEQNQTNILKDALKERQRLRNIAALETQNGFKKLSNVEIEKQPSISKGYGTFSSTSSSTTSGISSASVSDRLTNTIRQHDELDKKMKQVDATAKNSFPHKVSTTAQYMAAGAGIMLVTSSLTSMITAIVESDKAMGMFQAVLFSDSSTQKAIQQAKELQNSIFTIGKTYGGTVQDLNESALALGRAGIAGKDLATSIQAVSQVALLSGDSLDNITQLLVSWKTVYPEEKMNALADSMVGVANATLLSMDDLKTVTTYMLTAGQQAGLTSDSLLALAGSWRQLGKAPSTVGTESRRFFEQITSGADDVKKAYKALGINVDVMKKELAKGGPEAEAAMVQMFKVIGNVSKTEGQKAIVGLAGILDKATIQSLIAMSRTGKDGLTIYEKTLLEAGAKAEGSAKAGADKVALTYEKMWERIKNTLTQSSSIFGEALKVGFAGADSTVGSFNDKMASLDRVLSNLASTSGKVFGTILQYTDEMVVAYGTYKAVVIGGTVLEALGLIKTGLNAAKTAQYAFNLAAMRNPYIIAGTAIVAGVTYFYSMLEDAQDKFDASQNKTIKTHEAASTAAGTTNGKIKSLDDSYKALNSAIEKNRVLLSKASGTTKTGYENSIKSLEDQVKRNRTARAELTKGTPGSSKTPPPNLGAGSPELKGKKTTQASIESANKNLLDEEIQRIRLKEQQYFYDKDITSELEQQKHHVYSTLVDELVATQNAGEYKNKKEDALKLQVAILKGVRDITETEYQATLLSSRRLEDVQAEYKAIGYLSEEKLIELNYSKQLDAIERERVDLEHKKGGLSEDDVAYLTKKLELTDAQTEKLREQARISARLRQESADLTTLQIKAANATSGAEQIALEKKIIRQKLANEELAINERYKTITDDTGKLKQQELDNAKALAEQEERKVEGAQSYYDLLLASNIAYERQNSIAQGVMRVTESGLSTLSSGLSGILTANMDESKALSELQKQYSKDIANAKDSEEAAKVTQEYNKQTQAIREQYSEKEMFKKLQADIIDQIIKGLINELIVNQMILQVRQAMQAVTTPSSSGGGFWSTLGSAAMSLFSGGTSTSATYDLPSNYDYSSMDINNPMGSGGAWAKGGVSVNGNPTYLAKGGSYVNSIVSKPTYVAKGTIAGESGAEGVLPLQRDSQGRLGVNASGSSSRPQSITVNIVNESGEKLSVTKSEAKTDMSGLIIDVVLDAITRNKRGMRDMVRG